MSKDKKNDLKQEINESGIVIDPVYTEKELKESGGAEQIGAPGEYPFTRGIH